MHGLRAGAEGLRVRAELRKWGNLYSPNLLAGDIKVVVTKLSSLILSSYSFTNSVTCAARTILLPLIHHFMLAFW